MNLKISLIATALVLSLAACSGAENESSQPQASTPAEPEMSQQQESSTKETSEGEEIQAVFSVASEVIDIRVEFDKTAYTHDMTIGTSVTIDNHSGKRIAYVKGSGANIIPDAFNYGLGELADTFHPIAVTMDYRIEILEPGQKLELQLDFVPYIAKDKTKPIGTDKDIAFFRDSEDFTPAEPGKVEGKASFEYYLIPEDADEGSLLTGIEEQENHVVTLDLFTTIE